MLDLTRDTEAFLNAASPSLAERLRTAVERDEGKNVSLGLIVACLMIPD